NGCYIRWASKNEKHPRNWTRNFNDTSLIIILDLFTTAVSTAGATAAAKAQEEFGVERTLSLFLFLSAYLLGQGLGGVVSPPYSKAFDRKKLYVVSTALHSIFCVLIAAVPSPVMVVVGRFVTEFLSAIPAVIVAGSIEDMFLGGVAHVCIINSTMFNSRDRLWLIFLSAITANIGLVIGPIVSTYITADLEWQVKTTSVTHEYLKFGRWIFYVAAITTGVIAVLLLTIKESRPSLLLAGMLVEVREETGLEALQPLSPDHTPDMCTFT
ncbi:hypothetical protein M422DRAFT_181078, partial [Sphaerobolus stellatus SS14]